MTGFSNFHHYTALLARPSKKSEKSSKSQKSIKIKSCTSSNPANPDYWRIMFPNVQRSSSTNPNKVRTKYCAGRLTQTIRWSFCKMYMSMNTVRIMVIRLDSRPSPGICPNSTLRLIMPSVTVMDNTGNNCVNKFILKMLPPRSNKNR